VEIKGRKQGERARGESKEESEESKGEPDRAEQGVDGGCYTCFGLCYKLGRAKHFQHTNN
jgi:hypothetical protein